MDSLTCLGWKRPSRSSSVINWTLPSPPLNCVCKCSIKTSSEYLQRWWIHHFPGQPVPKLDYTVSDEIYPNVQSKPPMVPLEAISSWPVACFLGEETDPHLTTMSFQVALREWWGNPCLFAAMWISIPYLQTADQRISLSLCPSNFGILSPDLALVRQV